MITIEFEIESEHGIFRDAIVLPDDHGMTDEQIDAMKQARFQNWAATVSASGNDVPVEDGE